MYLLICIYSIHVHLHRYAHVYVYYIYIYIYRDHHLEVGPAQGRWLPHDPHDRLLDVGDTAINENCENCKTCENEIN